MGDFSGHSDTMEQYSSATDHGDLPLRLNQI